MLSAFRRKQQERCTPFPCGSPSYVPVHQYKGSFRWECCGGRFPVQFPETAQHNPAVVPEIALPVRIPPAQWALPDSTLPARNSFAGESRCCWRERSVLCGCRRRTVPWQRPCRSFASYRCLEKPHRKSGAVRLPDILQHR